MKPWLGIISRVERGIAGCQVNHSHDLGGSKKSANDPGQLRVSGAWSLSHRDLSGYLHSSLHSSRLLASNNPVVTAHTGPINTNTGGEMAEVQFHQTCDEFSLIDMETSWSRTEWRSYGFLHLACRAAASALTTRWLHGDHSGDWGEGDRQASKNPHSNKTGSEEQGIIDS